MERICRVCGRAYRGLVCHACHPRQKKARPEEAGIVDAAEKVELPADGMGQAPDVAAAVMTTTGPRG